MSETINTEFIEVRFPEDISYGATAGKSYSTEVVQTKSGIEKRNITWETPLRKAEVAHALKTPEQLEVLQAFHDNCFGMAIAFRFKDWSNYIINKDKCAFNTTDGKYDGGASFQVYQKVPLSNIRTRYFKVIKPVVDPAMYSSLPGFQIFKNDIEIHEYDVDSTTGIVTFTNPLSTLEIASISKNDNALITTTAPHGLLNGDKVSILNCAGMTEINGLVAKITINDSVSFFSHIDSTIFHDYIPAQPTPPDIVEAGQVVKTFLQDDIITFSCEYDVPMRFATDEILINIADYNAFTWNQIPLVEDRT